MANWTKRSLSAALALAAGLALAACAGGGDEGDGGSPTGPAVPTAAEFVGTWRLPEVGRAPASGFDVLIAANGTLAIFKNGAASPSAEGTFTVAEGFLAGEWRAVSGKLRGRAEAFFESAEVLHFAFIELNTSNPAATDGYLRSDHRGTRIR